MISSDMSDVWLSETLLLLFAVTPADDCSAWVAGTVDTATLSECMPVFFSESAGELVLPGCLVGLKGKLSMVKTATDAAVAIPSQTNANLYLRFESCRSIFSHMPGGAMCTGIPDSAS